MEKLMNLLIFLITSKKHRCIVRDSSGHSKVIEWRCLHV